MQRSKISLEDVVVGARFLRKLPSFLRRPITPGEAKATLKQRLENREADFLYLAKQAIFENPRSPYRLLLNSAGCEYGDLDRLVKQEGVEGALKNLYCHGVYITIDEFKSRKPLIRGTTVVEIEPGGFRNPLSSVHVAARTSGSRSKGTPVLIDTEFIRDSAVDMLLELEARGASKWLHASWAVPGSSVLVRLLMFSKIARPMILWFWQVAPSEAGLHPRYPWSIRALRWASLLAGLPLPRSLNVPLVDPMPIAHWMAKVIRTGQTPHLLAFASSVVRLCEAALEAGVTLSGAQFTLVGEPLTSSRLEAVRKTGAEARPSYGSIESGRIASGCLEPAASDDVHLLRDLHALIQPEGAGRAHGFPDQALLVSSLRATAPFIMLNVSLGDQAVVAQRNCSCPLERLGWSWHLQDIRSYEKLTSGGTTFLDTDLIRVLEEILPARFGGTPVDYQLVEDEHADGRPKLSLFIDPSVGPLDNGTVVEAFLAAITEGTGSERIMGHIWRDARLLRVERRAPLTTSSGKILHMHVADRASERTDPSRPTDAAGRRGN